jgi:hypothetical protein
LIQTGGTIIVPPFFQEGRKMLRKFTTLLILGAVLFTGCYNPVKVKIVNGLGSWDIEYVYISDTEEDDWGQNSLPMNVILAPGDSIEIAVGAGTFDIQVVDEDGDTYTRWEQTVPEEGYRWEVTLGEID